MIRMPALYESLLGRVPIGYLSADWLLTSFLDSVQLYDLYSPLKRLIDILAALIGLVFLVVTFPLAALLIRLDSPRPDLLPAGTIGEGRTFDLDLEVPDDGARRRIRRRGALGVAGGSARDAGRQVDAAHAAG